MGCSKQDPNESITIKWDNGTTSINGKDVYFSEYTGQYALIKDGMGGFSYSMTIDTSKDVTTLSKNTAGILEENMDKFKKKFYFVEYMGTRFTMAASIGEDIWSVVQVSDQSGDNTMTIAAYASDYIDNIPLTYGPVYVDFGSLVFGNEYAEVKVRPDGALITGVIKVSNDYHDCTEPYTVIQDEKEYQLMKSSSSKYDYYTYDGITIQIASGLDIQEYIQFK